MICNFVLKYKIRENDQHDAMFGIETFSASNFLNWHTIFYFEREPSIWYELSNCHRLAIAIDIATHGFSRRIFFCGRVSCFVICMQVEVSATFWPGAVSWQPLKTRCHLSGRPRVSSSLSHRLCNFVAVDLCVMYSPLFMVYQIIKLKV